MIPVKPWVYTLFMVMNHVFRDRKHVLRSVKRRSEA
jgi:hypothetical protein